MDEQKKKVGGRMMERKMSKQNRQLLTIIGLCVLLIALVLGFVCVTRYKDESEEREEAAKNIELYSIKDADITAFYFKNSSAELTFVKNKSKWMLQDDKKYSLDQSKVSTLINDVKEISATDNVTSDCTDLSQYGLKEPVLQVDITDKDGNKRKLTVGNESVAGEGRYAYIDDDTKKVYMIASTFTSDFETTKKELKAEVKATAAPTKAADTKSSKK